jgi:hypothetical protein
MNFHKIVIQTLVGKSHPILPRYFRFDIEKPLTNYFVHDIKAKSCTIVAFKRQKIYFIELFVKKDICYAALSGISC